MKNKKLTYLLGIVVLIVWGLILYRIFSAAGSGDDDQLPVSQAKKKEFYNDYTLPKDTTHLLLNYRDPFGLTKVKDTTNIVKAKTKSLGKVEQVMKHMDWSFVKYSGYLRNPGSKKLIAILTIHGKEAMLAEGESEGQVKLLKNMLDSVRISYEGKIRTITTN